MKAWKSVLKFVLVMAMAVGSTSIASAQTSQVIESDTFHRANETPLSYGGNWQAPPSMPGLQIVNNVVEAQALSVSSGVLWENVEWPINQFSQITLGVNNNSIGNNDFIWDRYDTVTQNNYSVAIIGPTGVVNQTHFLNKTLNGATTRLGSFTATIHSGDVFRVSATGTTNTEIVVTQNGTVVLDIHDTTSPLTVGIPGFGLWTGSVLTDNTIAAWEGGATSEQGGTVPCGLSEYSSYTSSTLSSKKVNIIEAVSLNGSTGQATFYLQSPISKLQPKESVSVSGLVTGDITMLNGLDWTIVSVGTSSGSPPTTPVVAELGGGASLAGATSIPYTVLPGTQLGVFDTTSQTIGEFSLTNNVVTANATYNDFAVGDTVLVVDSQTAGGILDGPHTVTSVGNGYFTFAFTHANITNTTEPDAVARGSVVVSVIKILEGQATGNLSCVTGSFAGKIKTTFNGTLHTTTGANYTPGTFYTLIANVANECDPPGCDYSSGAPTVIITTDTGDTTYNEGNNLYVEDGPCICNLPDYIEVALTKEQIPYPNEPYTQWTYAPPGQPGLVYAVFDQLDHCTNTPDYRPYHISDPFLIALAPPPVYFRFPATPPNYRWLMGLCDRPTGYGFWNCVGVPKVYVPSYNPFRSYCTQHD